MTSNIKINNGTNFNQKYKPYIFNGTTWVPSQAIVAENNYEIKTLSGNLINFSDGILNGTITNLTIEIPYTSDGITSTKLIHCGKNLFNDDKIFLSCSGWSKLSDHEYTGSTSNIYSSYKSQASTNGIFRYVLGGLLIKWNPQVTMSLDFKNAEGYTGSGGHEWTAVYNDGTNSDLINKEASTTYVHRTKTSKAGKEYIRKIYYTYGAATTMYFKNVQLEVGTSETTFEPYSGTTYTINFNKTIYGGTIDLLNGILISKYDSEGTLLATPETSYISSIPISQRNGINNLFTSHQGEINISYQAFDS